MAFQWGFGNDILLPSIVATAFDAVDDGVTWESGFGAVGAGALAGLVFWGGSQLLDAVIVLTGLKLLPGVTQRLSDFLQRKRWVTSYADMKWSTRWMIAYAAGASLLCLVDVFATGRPGIGQRRKMILLSAALSAGTIAVVVAMVLTATMVATRIPATEAAAELFIRSAKNPLTWLVVFLIVFLIGKARGSEKTVVVQPQEPSEA